MGKPKFIAPTTELDTLQQQLAAMQTSSSWRLTAPLRFIGKKIKQIVQPTVATCVSTAPVMNDYAEWVRQFDSPSAEILSNYAARIDGFAYLPLFSILLAVENATPEQVRQAIISVQAQIYPNWELCIVVAEVENGEMQALQKSYADDRRIKFLVSALTDFAQMCNQAFAMVSDESDWVIRLDVNFSIANLAMNLASAAINACKNCQIIYADEDLVSINGERHDPNFKPDWNLEFHLSRNLIGHFGMYRTALVRQVGAYRSELSDAMDFDLSLRCIEHVSPQQIVRIPHVLVHVMTKQLNIKNVCEAGVTVLNEHFKRLQIEAKAESIGYGYRVRYALPSNLPLVSLIIPTRNGLHLLRQCISSIQQKTSYPCYEIIVVDNGSDDQATLDYFKRIAADANVQVLRIDAPFNYSALNNMAVKVAKGELIGLVNNDVEVITPDWLSELVSQAIRPDVGAVGARLWFPDDTLQHGGVVLGIHGWAAHAHNHFPRGSLGYQGRMALVSEFSAVTGACLVVGKNKFESVGGLNEDALKISCNDVDLCLKLQKIGLRNIWTPFADLYHHESATRGFEDTLAKKARFASELEYMQRHWGIEMQNDAAYSPNLTMNAQDFGLAWPARAQLTTLAVEPQPGQMPLYQRLTQLVRGKRRVAYFAENINSSTYRYRVANMVAVLNATSENKTRGTSAASFFSSDLNYVEHIASHADVLVVSRARYDLPTAHLIQAFKAQNKKIWFDIDDLVFDVQKIDLIIDSLGQQSNDEVLNYWHAVVSRMSQTMRLCDGVITTNSFLANKISKYVEVPVRIIPNFVNTEQIETSIPLYERKLTQKLNDSDSINLGYFSGSATHNRDLALLLPALEILMLSDPRVRLTLVGPVELGFIFETQFSNRITRHGFTDFLKLQHLIAEVDFNLVPLLSNEFTDCKSELKFVDAALVGTITIASPVHAYANVIRHAENGYLAADDEWLSVLMQAIANSERNAKIAKNALLDVQSKFTCKTQFDALVQVVEIAK